MSNEQVLCVHLMNAMDIEHVDVDRTQNEQIVTVCLLYPYLFTI
jgi:hypothetical protein